MYSPQNVKDRKKQNKTQPTNQPNQQTNLQAANNFFKVEIRLEVAQAETVTLAVRFKFSAIGIMKEVLVLLCTGQYLTYHIKLAHCVDDE